MITSVLPESWAIPVTSNSFLTSEPIPLLPEHDAATIRLAKNSFLILDILMLIGLSVALRQRVGKKNNSN